MLICLLLTSFCLRFSMPSLNFARINLAKPINCRKAFRRREEDFRWRLMWKIQFRCWLEEFWRWAKLDFFSGGETRKDTQKREVVMFRWIKKLPTWLPILGRLAHGLTFIWKLELMVGSCFFTLTFAPTFVAVHDI